MNIRMTARRLYHRLLSAPCHLVAGRLAFARRAYDTAKAHFRKVLDVNPDHFSSHVFLARISLLEENESEAFRQMLAARRIDPLRFARLGLGEEYGVLADPNGSPSADPFLEDGFLRLGSGGADAPIASTGLESNRGIGFRAPRQLSTRPAQGDLGSPTERESAGDFTSAEEALRFKDLPPITRDDIASIDWDRVDSRAFERRQGI